MSQDIEQLIQNLEQFNEYTDEDEIEQLSAIATFVMDLGGIYSTTLQAYMGDTTSTNVNKLNELINSVDVNKIKNIYTSGILRYTCSLKEDLEGWDNLRLKVYEDCIKKGMDVNDSLYGLLEGMNYGTRH